MLTLNTKVTALLLLLCPALWLSAQEVDRSATIGLFGGLSSYQGDLQPNSFSFSQSGRWTGIWVRQPITGNFSIKAGVSIGTIKAADANNRDYLKIRNLSFYSAVKEAFIELDLSLLSTDNYRLTPFLQGGFALLHYNPYTFDNDGNKVYLQPLSTEGQGLPAYPDRKPYKLLQPAMSFGGGLRYAVSDAVIVSLQMSQRKTFTDYLDDVSGDYADEQELLQYRGPQAVELAYRGDELPGGTGYPKGGEQRGTPTEMDWYYFAGASLEIKLNAVGKLISNFRVGNNDWYYKRCPKVDF
mgnify:CR=1 FL=1